MSLLFYRAFCTENSEDIHSEHHLARSQGISRIEFVRQRLEKLNIVEQVTSFKANGRTHYLPSTS